MCISLVSPIWSAMATATGCCRSIGTRRSAAELTPGLLLASALAGGAYTLSPGPAFLALLGIGAGSGRRAGALFLSAHFAGDILWATLSLVAIIGARTIGTLFFSVLGFVCGVYLCWLGFRAEPAGRADAGTQ